MACSEECGEGLKYRMRGIATAAKFGGAECDGERLDEATCQIVPCPQDCEMSAWEDVEGAECSKSCGQGSIQQVRTVLKPQVTTGAACPGPNALLQANGTFAVAREAAGDKQHRDIPCNIQACPVDCVLENDWYEDGECSHDCGGGTQTFRKNVATQAGYGGVPCADVESEERLKTEDCNTQPCPIDCVLTQWTGWSECSASCSMGQQTRSRDVETAMDHGGEECETGREETQSCKTVECPIHCKFGEWTPWSTCDAACGPGSQTRTRGESIAAQHGGLPCEGENAEVQDCEDAPCPVHCELSDWKNEGDCSASCGTGEQKQIRTVTVEGNEQGNACDTNREQSIPCETQACPVDCELEDAWVEDGSCSKSCGGGKQIMRKGIKIGAANGGVECEWGGHSSRKKEEDCNTHACPTDCVVSAFGAWGECSTTCADGKRTRTRSVTTEPADGGAACPDPLEDITDCNLGPCPVDCAVGDWEEWGDCSVTCGDGGSQQRTRPVTTQEDHGGQACPDLMETRDQCANVVACPVHCIMEAWGLFGDCSVTCGVGQKEKTRGIATQPSDGGNPCEKTKETAMCDMGVCPVDCKVSGWSASGTCSLQCGGGEQTYVKYIEEQAVGTGTACPAESELTKTEPCNTHACPWAPVGEAGVLSGLEVINGEAVASVNFHMQYQTQPAIFFGPAPKSSDSEGFAKVSLSDVHFTGVSLLQKPADPEQPACNPTLLQKTGQPQPTCSDLGLEPPVKQVPVPVGGAPAGKIEACKCIGPEAGDILFGTNNHQYPTLYGKYCFPWPARDPQAAMAQANGAVELVYLGGGALGDGWAYNPVTKMRVYVASIIDLTIQVPGEPVKFPDGVKVPDAPDPNAIFPSGETDWCYVGADCPEAEKDGFHTWMTCDKAWDSRPGVPYPNDPNTCPVLGYDGPQIELTALTRKNNGDVCIGPKGDNSCNDPSPTGGSELGFVSSIQMTPNMIMLQRAYNDEAGDTCIFPSGEIEKWCKAEGEYSSPTDIGWIFTEGLAGTTPLIGKFNKGSQDSCANTDTGDMTCGVTASATSTTPAKYPVKLGTMGFLLKSQAEGAWSHCHNFEHYHATNEPGAFKYGLHQKAAKRRESSWSVSASVKVEGAAPASMKVSWMAFAQGVYETASDTIFQVGVAPIVADGEEKTIPLHQDMGAAPIVISQAVGSTVSVRQREASTSELYFIADGQGETVMVQWIAFEPTDAGYFGSVPFVAGMLDGASGEEKTWPEGEFTQPPLIFASIATARTDGEVSVRIVNNTPESTIFMQEGSQTDEKVAYMAYNGKGQGGAVINAETVHVQTYAYAAGSYAGTTCSRYGSRKRTVSCEGSNGKTYDLAFCKAFAGEDEPETLRSCNAEWSIITNTASGGKCMHYSKRTETLNMGDCDSAADQVFRFTSGGQGRNYIVAKGGTDKCLVATDGGVKVEDCGYGLDSNLWKFDDTTKQIHTESDTSKCLEVDPSFSNVLMGECAGGDTQLWEPESPELHAKAYGMFKMKYDNQCLYTALAAGSTSTGPVHRAICKKYHPEATWTLTLDDELKSDADIDGANCLTTTGAVAGEWDDQWSPENPLTLTMEGSKVIAKRRLDLPQCPHDHQEGDICSTWCNNPEKGWGCGYAHSHSCTCGGCNGCPEDIEGDVSKNPDGGGKLTLTFHSDGWGSFHGTIWDNKLIWNNGNTWTRKTPSLEMKPCTGASNQKWTDGDEFKSQVDDVTCIQWGEETGFFAGTCTGTAYSLRVWEGQPSWVTA
jgi:hypothetical protein